MTNISELLINIVTNNRPKMLKGLNQKVCGWLFLSVLGIHGHDIHRWISRVYPTSLLRGNTVNPYHCPTGRRTARNVVGDAGRG
ncbi:TPA: hypothetical protein G8O11_005493 [Salmonella enterica]|nr:hypothetical protein [Salmonella enterica subsp. enterica]HAF4899164.1 hypothetical protein [Salmonella enterica]